jgi:hypothetical protein
MSPRILLGLGLFPDDLGNGDLEELRVLEALAPALKPMLLERLLDDDYLTGHRGFTADYWWAADQFSSLTHSVSLRQLDVIEDAMPGGTEMGSRPRSKLGAALARRRAALGDLAGFERTWRRIADSQSERGPCSSPPGGTRRSSYLDGSSLLSSSRLRSMRTGALSFGRSRPSGSPSSARPVPPSCAAGGSTLRPTASPVSSSSTSSASCRCCASPRVPALQRSCARCGC